MKALNNLRQKALLLLLLMAAGAAKAQSHEFAPVGAEWYYERFYREGFDLTGITYDRFRSLRTVEINGWECKEIELFQNLDCSGEVNPHVEYHYIHQDGNQVYEVENGERYLLYDFGKEEGEWWYAPKYNDTIYVYGVDSIPMQDGNYRKKLRLCPNNNSHLYFGNLIEGIGLDLSVFPFELLVGSPCVHGSIRCYSEHEAFLIVSEMEECDYEILAVDEYDESPKMSINTLVENTLHIVFLIMTENVKQINIIDSMGRIIHMTKTMDNMLDIDLSGMPSGVYFVQTIISSQMINKKIVKR